MKNFLAIYSLQHNKYYIENTNDVYDSFQRHIDGIGGNYTQIHAPIQIIEYTSVNTEKDIEILINKYKTIYGSLNLFFDL